MRIGYNIIIIFIEQVFAFFDPLTERLEIIADQKLKAHCDSRDIIRVFEYFF
jgi:hypothetical protein